MSIKYNGCTGDYWELDEEGRRVRIVKEPWMLENDPDYVTCANCGEYFPVTLIPEQPWVCEQCFDELNAEHWEEWTDGCQGHEDYGCAAEDCRDCANLNQRLFVDWLKEKKYI